MNTSRASRHFTDVQATRVAWLPFPSANLSAERVVALGGWCEEVHSEVLALVSLVPSDEPQAPPTLRHETLWKHDGAVTDIQAR